jgi:hypothetical protein
MYIAVVGDEEKVVDNVDNGLFFNRIMGLGVNNRC